MSLERVRGQPVDCAASACCSCMENCHSFAVCRLFDVLRRQVRVGFEPHPGQPAGRDLLGAVAAQELGHAPAHLRRPELLLLVRRGGDDIRVRLALHGGRERAGVPPRTFLAFLDRTLASAHVQA